MAADSLVTPPDAQVGWSPRTSFMLAILVAGAMHLLVFAGWPIHGFKWAAAPAVSVEQTLLLVPAPTALVLPSIPDASKVGAVLQSPVTSQLTAKLPTPKLLAPKPTASKPAEFKDTSPAAGQVNPTPKEQLPSLNAPPQNRSAGASLQSDKVVTPAKPSSESLPLTLPRHDAAYLHNPAPVYPVLSRRRKEEGTVHLDVRVNPSGLPVRVVVRDSSGYSRLDDAAINAVQQWRFEPARRGSTPVESSVTVPVRFVLNR